MTNIPLRIMQVESLLPQTQCEKCGYKGCRPYAEALVRNQAPVNLCSPGGQPTADAIANLLKAPKQTVSELPHPKQVAVVREADCIGCTKCIQACPVDAIIGASKHMHTILESECTGCGLCLPPCPTLCIELKPVSHETPSWIVGEPLSVKAQADYYKSRMIAKKERAQAQTQMKSNIRRAKTNLDLKAEILKSIQRKANDSKQTTGAV